MNFPVDISESGGIRSLHLGSDWVQGSMRIKQPDQLVLAYTQEMMAGLLFRPAPWPDNILIIGLGAGSVAKFLYRHAPGSRITVVEIAPRVTAAARQFFHVPDDDTRFQVVTGCGAEYLASSTVLWDLILVDGYDPDARAGVLGTAPFYHLCRSRLTPDGMACFNLFGRTRGFSAQIQQMETCFDGAVLDFPSCDSGNAVAFAFGDAGLDMGLDDLRQEAEQLRTTTALDLRPTLSRLEKSGRWADGRLRCCASSSCTTP